MIPELKNALMEERAKSKSLYVFSMKDGSFLSEASFRRMWDLISYRSVSSKTGRELVERTIDFEVHPHQLRHTCITAWIKAGIPVKSVMYLAGHSTLEMTMKIYNHYLEDIERTRTAELMRSSTPEFFAVM